MIDVYTFISIISKVLVCQWLCIGFIKDQSQYLREDSESLASGLLLTEPGIQKQAGNGDNV